MSEEREEVGRITISFTSKGSPVVAMLGEIPQRPYNALPIHLRKAIVKHKADLRRGSKKVDMSDKGKTLADYASEEEFNEVQPAADPASAEGLQARQPQVGLDNILPIVGEEVANDDKEPVMSEGEQNGNDSGSEEVRGDDAEPGSKGSSWGK
jgi:hypothetical protein